MTEIMCKTCKHGKQWHTDNYGCLGHPKNTQLLESVCICNKTKEQVEKENER